MFGKGSDLLSIADLTPEDIERLIALAQDVKRQRQTRTDLAGKTLGLLFEKPSTRTKVSFCVAMTQLGGVALTLDSADIGLGKRETVADVGRVLSRYLDAVVIRTFGQDRVNALAGACDIPVINGLSNQTHPCQGLTDLMTLRERFGRLKGLRVAYIGDGNNVLTSLIWGAVKTGIHLSYATPRGYEPDASILRQARAEARSSGAQITACPAKEVARGAQALYTDVWTSMGQESQSRKRQKAFRGYQINRRILSFAASDCIVMHCLPAHRGQEITDEVIDSPQSAVWDQAENRLHLQKALLLTVLSG